MKKIAGDIIISHKCTRNHNHMRYKVRQTFWAIFCHFTLLAIGKIKILKKWKKHLEISLVYTCIPKMTIIWCMLHEIWNKTDIIFCHFGPFSAQLLTLLTTWKIKVLKKWKNHLKILSFYTCIPQMMMMMIIWSIVPEIWSRTGRTFCHFGLFFALLPPPPKNLENQNFEKMKKVPADIIILYMCTMNENYMMYDSWHMERNRQNFFSF